MDDDENDILTTLDLAHAWGVTSNVAKYRAAKFEKELGIVSVRARAPNGREICAYSRSDGERIIEEQRALEALTEANQTQKKKKAKEIEFETGSAERPDVMTVHELAEILNVNRSRASQIARRLEGQLGIERIEARAPSAQKIIAYKWSDGELLVNKFKKKRAAKKARREAKEKRAIERIKLPQPPAPSSRNELFYVIELHPGDANVYKLGWTSDIEQRRRNYRTTSPNLRLVKSWPCKRERDREAMDYAFSFQGLQKTGLETFRTQDIRSVVRWLDQFFESGLY